MVLSSAVAVQSVKLTNESHRAGVLLEVFSNVH